MHRLMIAASGLVLAAGLTTAQAQAPSNVPQAQSICQQGYGKAVVDGKLQDRAYSSPETLSAVDTDKDGRISKTEFDNACSKNLFKRSERNTG